MAADIVGISSMATRQILAERSGAYRQKTGRSVAIEFRRRSRCCAPHPGRREIRYRRARRRRHEEARGGRIPQVGEPRRVCRFGDCGGRTIRSQASRSLGRGCDESRSSLGAIDWLLHRAERHACAQAAGKMGRRSTRSTVRIIQAPPGVPVGTLVARGEAELGFQQLSEFLDVPGIDIVGTLPQEIQSLTRFSCGVCALATNEAGARDLIGYLTSPEADASKRRHGMEPV